jgi:hypothetical protein
MRGKTSRMYGKACQRYPVKKLVTIASDVLPLAFGS